MIVEISMTGEFRLLIVRGTFSPDQTFSFDHEMDHFSLASIPFIYTGKVNRHAMLSKCVFFKISYIYERFCAYWNILNKRVMLHFPEFFFLPFSFTVFFFEVKKV